MERKLPILKIYSVEVIVVLTGVATLALYRATGIPPRQPLSLYTARLSEALGLYAVSLVLLFLFVRLKALKSDTDQPRDPISHTARRFAAERLTFGRLTHDFRLMNAVALVFVLFIQLKHLTPYLRSTVFDAELLSMEQSLFGGALAGQLLMRQLPVDFAAALSDSYVFFYPYMAFLILYFILSPKQVGSGFCTAFALCWFLGIGCIYALPSWGPCFFRPELFAQLPVTQMAELQADLWKNKLFLDSHPGSAEGVFLISGFPSLHVAIPLLGTALFLRRSQSLAICSGVLTFFTALATLYFGWHYAVDDLAAVPLVALALLLQCVVDRFLQRILGRYLAY